MRTLTRSLLIVALVGFAAPVLACNPTTGHGCDGAPVLETEPASCDVGDPCCDDTRHADIDQIV